VLKHNISTTNYLKINFAGFLTIFMSFFFYATGIANNNETITLVLENSLSDARKEVVKIDLNRLKQSYPNFNFQSFQARDDQKIVDVEIIKEAGSMKHVLLIHTSFLPDEKKIITLSENRSTNNDPPKKTQAYLGEKKNYQLMDGVYTGGNFESVHKTILPPGHFAHNALYQYEGPGWESELIGYRLYLDSRNRIDIFGKKKQDLFINEIGKNDLVSDGKESYQKMQDWGMDIFKVGSTLGIGSIAAYNNNEVVSVSTTIKTTCEIFDNNLLSEVKINYNAWQIGKNSFDLTSILAIRADSRLTSAQHIVDGNDINFCTGLAKHSGTEFIVNDNNEWGYIAVWGKQTLVNDNLGIALFFNTADVQEITENEINHLVIFKPSSQVEYYFAALWEQEPQGPGNKHDFLQYLDEKSARLNSPIQINIE
jgi:hypothetical protein